MSSTLSSKNGNQNASGKNAQKSDGPSKAAPSKDDTPTSAGKSKSTRSGTGPGPGKK